MNQNTLITGENLCKRCNEKMEWSINTIDPEVKIIGGFINSENAGNDIEFKVLCCQCNKINIIHAKSIIKSI